MRFFKRILCYFGIHKWIQTNDLQPTRKCVKCKIRETYYDCIGWQ